MNTITTQEEKQGFNHGDMRASIEQYQKYLSDWWEDKLTPYLLDKQNKEKQEDALLATYTYARLFNHMIIGVIKYGDKFKSAYTPDEYMEVVKNKAKAFQSIDGKEQLIQEGSEHHRKISQKGEDYTSKLDFLAPKTEQVELTRELPISQIRRLMNRLMKKENPTEKVVKEQDLPEEKRKEIIQEQFSQSVKRDFYQNIAGETLLTFDCIFSNLYDNLYASKASRKAKTFESISAVKEMALEILSSRPMWFHAYERQSGKKERFQIRNDIYSEDGLFKVYVHLPKKTGKTEGLRRNVADQMKLKYINEKSNKR
ncbi:MAG: hypothetical protein J6N49_06390 [Alphaproteobacteria bacterium]|nr:hypothetical protein [Alphaproteobacteria bacterium]